MLAVNLQSCSTCEQLLFSCGRGCNYPRHRWSADRQRPGDHVLIGVDLVKALTGEPGQIDLLAFLANNTDVGSRLLIDDIGPDPAAGPNLAPVDVPTLGGGPQAGLMILLLAVPAVALFLPSLI